MSGAKTCIRFFLNLVQMEFSEKSIKSGIRNLREFMQNSPTRKNFRKKILENDVKDIVIPHRISL